MTSPSPFRQMRSLSRNMVLKKALIYAVISLLVISLVSCFGRSSFEDVIRTQIVGTFPDTAAVQEILQIGEFDQERQCRPVKARVIQGYTFGHRSEKVFEYCFQEDNAGNWKIVRRSEDEKPLVKTRLTWQDASSDELGFKIERKTGLGGTYRQIAIVGPNVTSYTDTGLSQGTTYYYRVSAYNSKGQSPYFQEILFQTPAD